MPKNSKSGKTASGLKSARLTELHMQHQESPPTAREARAAEENYLKSVDLLARRREEMKALLGRQQEVSEAKAETEKRHRAEIDRLRLKQEAEWEKLVLESATVATRIHDQSRLRKDAEQQIDIAAERLALAHGVAPVELRGVVHDWQCYGPRVYLVPRTRAAPPAAPTKPKRK